MNKWTVLRQGFSTFFDVRDVLHASSRASLLPAAFDERRVRRLSRIEGCCTAARRWRSRVRFVRSLHEAFRISISGALAFNKPSSLRLPIPLCPFIQRPSSSRGVSPPHLVVPQESFHPCSSRVRFAWPSRSFVRESRRYVAIFCQFYFGEHLVAGTRTKGTCSLRKSSRRRQEGGSRTRLGLFTCS